MCAIHVDLIQQKCASFRVFFFLKDLSVVVVVVNHSQAVDMTGTIEVHDVETCA